MSRNSKTQNLNKLINVIDQLTKRQDELTKYIQELEEYIALLEIFIDQEDQEFIDPIGDNDAYFKNLLGNFEELGGVIENGLDEEQMNRLNEIKSKKQNLHSLEDLLKIVDEKEDNE